MNYPKIEGNEYLKRVECLREKMQENDVVDADFARPKILKANVLLENDKEN